MGKIGPVVSKIFHFQYLRSSSFFLSEVVFVWLIFMVWFGQISLSLKSREDQTSGCWDISFLIFEVVFLFSIGGRLHLIHFYSLGCSYKPKFKIWWRLDQWLLRTFIFLFEVVFLFSIGGRLHLIHFYSLVWSHKLEFKIWGRSDQWLLRCTTFRYGYLCNSNLKH